MKTFNDYMLLAISRHGLRGQNALAREIGIKSSAMSHLNTGKALPAESTMIKLAELAGLPKEEALIDLNLWRSAKDPALQTVWLRLAKMISKCLIFIIFFDILCNTAHAESFTENQDTINTAAQYIKDYATKIKKVFAAFFQKIKSLFLKQKKCLLIFG